MNWPLLVLEDNWESKSLLRILSQNSLIRHIWFVLSISVYWEESSRGWGGNALFEIFCNVSESTVYNENNGLGKTATRRQRIQALETLMWKPLLGFFTCFISLLSSKGQVRVNASVEMGFAFAE